MVSTRAEQGKAGKYSTAEIRVVECMVVQSSAVQGRKKMNRFRRVRAVQGKTRIHTAGQKRQMCCTTQNIIEHKDPCKCFTLYQASQ